MASNVAEYRSSRAIAAFQLKVGGDAELTTSSASALSAERSRARTDKLVADANTGWLMHDAMRVVNAVRDVDVYIEQPCAQHTSSVSASAATHTCRLFSTR